LKRLELICSTFVRAAQEEANTQPLTIQKVIIRCCPENASPESCEAVILVCLNYHENVNSYAYSKLKGRVNGNEYDCVDL